MRLFPEASVTSFFERGWWSRATWDSWVRAHADSRANAVSLVDPPNRTTFTDGEPRRLTWSEVDEQVDRLAAVLHDHGIGADDVVGIQLPNIAELALSYLALARLGAIATPFPVQYREHELETLLPLVEAMAMLTATRILGRANAVALERLKPDVASLTTVFAWGDDVPEHVVGLDAATAAADDRQALAAFVASREIHPNDCATICWTSGTESIPKGIPRAFGDWAVCGATCIDAPQIGADDVIANPFPMVNMGGIGGLFCPWIATGCTLVLHQPFDLEVFLGQIQSEGVNYTNVAPAILTRLLQESHLLDTYDLSSLRAVGSGSAPVPGWTITGWEQRGVEVLNFFGSNEGLNLVSDRTSVPDPQDRGHLFPSYRGDTSALRVRVAQFTDVRLVGDDGHEIESPGRVGELRLHGPSVFSGYWTGTGKPGAFDDDGYYCSGDLFEYVDDSLQLLSYRGRATDLIVRGGFNISPAEIENVLHGHPKIAEVAVVGVPDDVIGDRIWAFVVPVGEHQPTLDELIAVFAEQHVAKFKWPERLELMDALPRNPLGKVLHRELRARISNRT